MRERLLIVDDEYGIVDTLKTYFASFLTVESLYH